MNNSFTQKAQHYLNESYRLTEELDAEIQYSALLEAVLEELVGPENFLALMEVWNSAGSVATTNRQAPDGTRIYTARPTAHVAPGRNNQENFLRRAQQLRDIADVRGGKVWRLGKLASQEDLSRYDDAQDAFANVGGVIPSGIVNHDYLNRQLGDRDGAPETLSGVTAAVQNAYPTTVDPVLRNKLSIPLSTHRRRQLKVSKKTQAQLATPQPGYQKVNGLRADFQMSRSEHARKTNARDRMMRRIDDTRKATIQSARERGEVILPRDSALPKSTKRFDKTN